MFRAKKLDIGCYVNIHIIRDHSKRKAFEAAEPERSVESPINPPPLEAKQSKQLDGSLTLCVALVITGKRSDTSFATRRCLRGRGLLPSCNSHRCTATRGRRRSRTAARWVERGEPS